MFRAALSLIVCLVVACIADGNAAAQQSAGPLKTIIETQTIRIAYRNDAAPFSFINEKKEVTGYTIDLCKRIVVSIAQQFSLPSIKIQWIPVTSQNRFDVVASGKADLECGSSSATLARMKDVDFSTFIFVESTGLVVNAASGAQRLLDLAGKKIAVVAGTSNEKAIAAVNEQTKLNAELVPIRDREAGVAALQSGSADAFANDKMLLVGLQFKYPQTMRLLPDDLSTEYYAIVLPRGDWALRLAVNTALARIYRSGQGLDVFNRWFPQVGLRPGLLLHSMYLIGAVPE